MKKYTLDQAKDRFIGEAGTPKREQYEIELKIELIGEMIRNVRKERNLTQSELGEMIGVKKAQISRLENNTKNVSIEKSPPKNHPKPHPPIRIFSLKRDSETPVYSENSSSC